MRARIFFLACFLLLAPRLSAAQDLGVQGTVYDIQEEDAVAYIKRRLTDMDRAGELKALQEKAKQKVVHSMLYPEPIKGITTATKNRTFYYDPTYVQEKNVVDKKGRILIAAGTSVNPLEHGGLSKHYIFIDARDTKQVEFAVDNHTKRPADKIVLTGGSWAELSKKLKAQVYYDQSGYLTKRFSIFHVPAVVSQDGSRLRIEELAL